jgi:opacity protein-like surface antigen
METSYMRFASKIRVALVAVAALMGAASAAHADSGQIYIEVLKGGWFIGASGGSGTLTFNGRRYPLSIGGVSAGLVFGASKTDLHGRVSNIRRPSDVAGVYGAAGAGAAVGVGARVIVLRNEKGALLELSGRQIGLIANLDLSGLAISLR